MIDITLNNMYWLNKYLDLILKCNNTAFKMLLKEKYIVLRGPFISKMLTFCELSKTVLISVLRYTECF